jgi:hypothetical protein
VSGSESADGCRGHDSISCHRALCRVQSAVRVIVSANARVTAGGRGLKRLDTETTSSLDQKAQWTREEARRQRQPKQAQYRTATVLLA